MNKRVFLPRVLLLAALSIVFTGLITVRHQLPVAYQKLNHSGQMELAAQARIGEAFGKLPLAFESNQGQTDGQVKFISRGNGYNLFLTSNEAVLSLKKDKDDEAVLRMRLLGANGLAVVNGLDELPGKVNYFVGNDPEQWHTNIPIYAKVKYESVYPGIDMVYYGNQGRLEYDFIVGPGADPDSISLGFDGAEELSINENGDLVLSVDGGELYKSRPVLYQERDGERQLIAGDYEIKEKGRVGFRVADYDRNRPLFIDPVLIYSTFLGGGGGFDNVGNGDFPQCLGVDSEGNAYIGGTTTSAQFPLGTLRNIKGIYSAYVAKLNPTGTALVYLDYLDGANTDEAIGIAMDSAGNAVVTGYTNSGNFPTTEGAYQRILNRSTTSPAFTDAFVIKLNPLGGVIFSTFVGGNFNDIGYGIVLDSSDNIYLTGRTDSSNFPTTAGAFQTSFKGSAGSSIYDAVFAKLNANGSQLLYGTYLGGNTLDVGYGIAVDTAGNAYITGYTDSINYPTTPGAFQTTYHPNGACAVSCPPNTTCGNRVCYDSFVTKFNSSGSLVYSTYLGGDGNGGDDVGVGIAVDSSGNAFIAGYTGSSNFPTTQGAFQTVFAAGFGKDIFVTKLNATGSPVYSTFIGGTGNDSTSLGSIALDSFGSVYLTGITSSTNLPLVNPVQNFNNGGSDGNDAFIIKLNPKGNALGFSTYLGGCATDYGIGIRLDIAGNILVSGLTTSSNAGCIPLGARPFPTTSGAFDTQGAISSDGFVAKISNPCSAITLTPDTLPGVAVGANYSQTIIAGGGSTPYEFSLTAGSLPPGFTLSSSGVISGSTTQAGDYSFTVMALDNLGCPAIKSYTITISPDTIAPTITAPPNVTVNTGAGATTCGTFVSNEILGTAIATDNLPGVIVSRSAVPVGNIFPVGTTDIIYTATDAAGNTATTTQKVIVKDNTPPAISAPADASYQCSSEVPVAQAGDAIATDNCAAPTVTVSEINNGGVGSSASPLIITRTYTATDTSGNIATAIQTITVSDITAPVFNSVPPAVTVMTGAGAISCGAFVSNAVLGTATASDNCLGMISISRSGIPSGNLFPVGTTTITYTAVDAVGNQTTANQSVTVIDNTAPSITAPPDLSLTTSTAPVSLTAAQLGTPTASDNCAIASMTNNAPSSFPAGITIVTYTATDVNGNSSTATQRVTINLQTANQTVTINVLASLHKTGNGGSQKVALNLALKVFDLAKLVGPFNPKDYGAIWQSGPGLTSPTLSISGPSVVAIGGGQANQYVLTVPSNDPANSATASGSYLVIGQAVVNGIMAYTGRQTDSLATGSATDMFLQLILTPNGKIAPAVTTPIPGSLLLITEPEYLEFTSAEEILPIIYESVEGDWSSVVQADVPAGYVCNPGAMQASVSTSQIQVLEFTVKDTGNQLSAMKIVYASSKDEKTAKVVHHLKHKGRDITVTTNVRVINKK